jgi:hypothetical protein
MLSSGVSEAKLKEEVGPMELTTAHGNQKFRPINHLFIVFYFEFY